MRQYINHFCSDCDFYLFEFSGYQLTQLSKQYMLNAMPRVAPALNTCKFLGLSING